MDENIFDRKKQYIFNLDVSNIKLIVEALNNYIEYWNQLRTTGLGGPKIDEKVDLVSRYVYYFVSIIHKQGRDWGLVQLDGPGDWLIIIKSCLLDLEDKLNSIKQKEIADRGYVPNEAFEEIDAKIFRIHEIENFPIFQNVPTEIATKPRPMKTAHIEVQATTFVPGEQGDFYIQLRRILKSAKVKILIIDPYIDQGLIDEYLEDLSGNVELNLLISNPSTLIIQVIKKFLANPNKKVSSRTTTEIHDRIIIIDGSRVYAIGQSIKDAAVKKPTYIAPINDPRQIITYEEVWNRGVSI